MRTALKNVLQGMIALGLLLLAAIACGGDSAPPSGTLEVTSEQSPNRWVTGTVTYRERLALTPDATLEMELRDVSYADAAAPLIARQVIPDPGQVPIKFRVGYNKDDISDRNRYSVSARIVESDGRLAFTNDTAYEVITRGNPNRVDMVLVLVEPPPELVEQSDTDDWRTWVEAPVQPISAEWIPSDPELLVMVKYYRSTTEGCSRPGNETLELEGTDLKVTVTLKQPPSTTWAIPCDEDLMELESIVRTEATLEPGESYRILVNGQLTGTFTLPEDEFPDSAITQSLVESVEVVILESAAPQYQLRVVAGMPKGSGCSRFNGYAIKRASDDKVQVQVTQHEVVDPMIACIADFPIVETTIPLGSDFEPKVEYTVVVNDETTEKFTAQ